MDVERAQANRLDGGADERLRTAYLGPKVLRRRGDDVWLFRRSSAEEKSAKGKAELWPGRAMGSEKGEAWRVETGQDHV